MKAPNSAEGSEQPTTSSLKSAEIALSDPLKPETRKARLYLLGVSMVGITIVYTGLVPQEIATLGITFGEADRQSLLFILALAIFYFGAAFTIYGITDFVAWRSAYISARWPELQAEVRRPLEEANARVQEAQAMLEVARKRLEEEATKELSKEEREAARLQLLQKLHRESVALREVDAEIRRREAHQSPRGRAWSRAKSMFPGYTYVEQEKAEQEKAARRYAKLAPNVSWARALFEFLLPILVGLYAIYALLSA